MSPLRNPPSVRVECWREPVFGSTSGDAGGAVAAAVFACSTARRAGVFRAVLDLVVFGFAADDVPVLRAVPDLAFAVVRDPVDVRAAVVFFAAPDDFALAAVDDLRAVDDLAEPVRADAVDLEPPFAAVVLRVVPDLDAVLFFAVLLVPPELFVPPVLFAVLLVPVLVVALVGLAVVVMTFAAASIALAASVIALVALVIALVIAVMALADEEALVATDFICVAAVLAWLAALVTRVAAADGDVRAADADFFAVPVLVPDLAAVVRPVVVLPDDFAADVLFAAGFLAAVDLFADVLFVLVGTDLPPVMISYGEIYSTVRDPLHLHT